MEVTSRFQSGGLGPGADGAGADNLCDVAVNGGRLESMTHEAGSFVEFRVAGNGRRVAPCESLLGTLFRKNSQSGVVSSGAASVV